jgi:hypothetical protein
MEQAAKSSLTTLQATTLISIQFGVCGMDKIGRMYLLRAVAMAHDLKLFDPPRNIKSNRMCNSRSFTAWGLFNYQT